MSGTTTIVRNNDKTKNLYRSYGIAFDGAGLWSFGNYFAWNVIIFGDDDNSSSHIDNHKNNFSVLGERSTDDINDSVCTTEKSGVIKR